MHVGRGDDLRGAAAVAATSSARTSSRGCTSCRATGRSSRSRGSRWAGRSGSTTRRFNLDYHVRHTALPAPGVGGAAPRARRPDLLAAARPLEAAVGAVARPGARGQPLRADQQDPPLARRRRLRRGHHDRAVRPRRRCRRRSAPETAGRRRRALGRRAGRRGRGRPRRDAVQPRRRGALGALQRPGETLGRGARGGRGPRRGGLGWHRTRRPTSAQRARSARTGGCSGCRAALADLKEIKNALGGTVNDVFLAVVAGALARWLRGRGVRTEGVELRALVPVSIRADDEQGALGNRITAMLGPLPVYADDPVERLRIVREAMGELKESKQALGAEVITGLQDFAPPTILAQASRLNFSTRALQPARHERARARSSRSTCSGARCRSSRRSRSCPSTALAVAIMSYNGKVDIGLIARLRRDARPRRVRRAPRGVARRAARRRAERREGEREVERAQEGRHAGHGAEEDDHVVNTAERRAGGDRLRDDRRPLGPAAAAGHGARDAADPLGHRALRAARRARLPRDPLRQPRRRALDQDRSAPVPERACG